MTLRKTGVLPAAIMSALAICIPLREVLGAEPPRGVFPLDSEETSPSLGFDPAQSAGLFVGVRRFTSDESLTEVPFAVDDAIDLAYLFSLELSLLDPRRVVLALSGEPVKERSRRRLADLKQAGAAVEAARAAEIRGLLTRQARVAAAEGLLVASFATHGLTADGIHYLMAEDSHLSKVEKTSISSRDLFEEVARSRAVRRLVLLDACHERAQSARSGEATSRDPMSPALADAMARAAGQVILSAARPGGYAFDDYTRGNGVFTAFVLEGLRCKAETDDQGFVTAGTLASYVNRQVTDWVRKSRNGRHPSWEEGIESRLGGFGPNLPLVRCLECPVAVQPAKAESADDLLKVQGPDGNLLWARRVSGRISRSLVADLNGDGSQEVVLGIDSQGADTGKVQAFDCKGNFFWSFDTAAPFNYGGGHSDRMAVVNLEAADLFQQGRRQVVSLSIDAQAWYQSRLCILDSDGTLLASYWHPGHLSKLVIGAPTAQDSPKIVVEGLNNDLGSLIEGDGHFLRTIFQLDPRQTRGEAPPYSGRSGKGTQDWYGFLLPKGLEIARLAILDQDGDGHNEIQVWTTKGHVLYLNFQGELLRSAGSDGIEGTIRFGLIRDKDQ